MRRVLVLVGPTASGKTTVSLLLARHLKGEIVSADSRQVYRFMEIGTAKPSASQRKRAKHYFVDELTPDQEFNAGEFGKKGRMVVEEIFRRNKQPIVVGGSGLYIQSLVDGFFAGPSRDQELRETLYEKLHAEGAAKLLKELQAVDPDTALRVLPSNTRRIVRALEVYYLTGIPISRHHRDQAVERTFEPVFFGLAWGRETLYDRINARVERMIRKGLVQEVRSLLKRGYSPSLNSLQTVGYREACQYLEGKIDRTRMVELIKQNSRRFAKRQLTWFRRDKRIRWLPVRTEKDFPHIVGEIVTQFSALSSD